MLLDLGMVVGGLVVLLLAGDLLVKGAVNLSLRLGIPALLVGMTVVAFGTSAPELLVSVRAAIEDAGGLALGNVVGSNIANILLVLGAPALISAMAVGHDITRDYAIMIGASLLFIAVAFTGQIGDMAGAGSTGRICAVHGRQYPPRAEIPRGTRRAGRRGPPALAGPRSRFSLFWAVSACHLGQISLSPGPPPLPTDLGVSDALIGLTLVAIGTSLPELAATVMAAIRREGGVALGNIVGSNLFNLLFILGTAGLFGTMVVPPEMFRLDLWVIAGRIIGAGAFHLAQKPPSPRAVGRGLASGVCGLSVGSPSNPEPDPCPMPL